MRSRLLLSEKFHIDVSNDTVDMINKYMDIGNEIIDDRNKEASNTDNNNQFIPRELLF